MRTLFPAEANWSVFFLLAIILRLVCPFVSWPCYLALLISLHQFMLLITFIGYIIPVRYLFGAFMCLQFFIGPSLAYNGLDQYQYWAYRMKIPEGDYFMYAIPAVVSFLLGLHIKAGNYNGEYADEKKIASFLRKHPRVPYIFIITGFCASILSNFFPSEVAFVLYILGGLKFIGLFILILGDAKIKLIPLILVLGSIVVSSLGDGMFHDLLIWILFIGSVYAIKYKFNMVTKLVACVGFILLAVVIQQLKGSYRAALWQEGQTGSLDVLEEVYDQQNQDGHSIFSFGRLVPSLVRINQGFIITNIMKTVPNRVPFSKGEEMGQILEAAVLPRILAPNKLQAGDRAIFEKYSGIHLRTGTSMGLSSLGDAYLNFGVEGGCFFMFLLGFSYSVIMSYFQKRSRQLPIMVLFLPLIFYYPIRPDCELQTILGHFIKATFIILVLVYCFKRTLSSKEKTPFLYPHPGY